MKDSSKMENNTEEEDRYGQMAQYMRENGIEEFARGKECFNMIMDRSTRDSSRRANITGMV